MRAALLAILLVASVTGCREEPKAGGARVIALSKAMGGTADSGFARALAGRPFSFPGDHGPHPDFRTEWWYFTGNVLTPEGRPFGYQVTVFRIALRPETTGRRSAWASNQIYMGHVALTDVRGDRHVFQERFSREGSGLAGAQSSPFAVWLEDWRIRQVGGSKRHDLPVIRVQAGAEDAVLDLVLEATKPIVLQGDGGLSRKGADPGNASYYYSSTRLKTAGTIALGGNLYQVEGDSWMDREWSTSALGGGQQGWDWFALQLSDTTELMYYQIRGKEGLPDEFSNGSLVLSDGSSVLLSRNDVVLAVTDGWRSPAGVTYPSGWRLSIPSRQMELTVTPTVRSQLMDVSVRYWEGSVTIEGIKEGKPLSGTGYVELTGY